MSREFDGTGDFIPWRVYVDGQPYSPVGWNTIAAYYEGNDMSEEYVSRESLIKCGASPTCRGLKEMLEWLEAHVPHYHLCKSTFGSLSESHGPDGLIPAMHRESIGQDFGDSCKPAWPTSAVVSALFQHRPKFAGIDGYQWLIDHDERAKKCIPVVYPKSEECSVKAKAEFDPKELQVNDEVEWKAGTRFVCHNEITEVIATTEGRAVDIVAWVARRTSGSLIIVFNDGAMGVFDRDARGNITRVVRPDSTGKMVQIYPVVVPKLEVGTWRKWNLDMERFVIERTDMNGDAFWRSFKGHHGCDRAHYIFNASTPCAQFEKGDIVEWHGTRFKLDRILPNSSYPYRLSTMDGTQWMMDAKADQLTLIEPAKEA